MSPSRHWFDHPLPCPPGSHISLCQDVSAPPCVSGEGLGIFTSMVDICLLTVQSLWRLRLFGRYFVDGSIQYHSCFCSFLFWMFVSLLKLLLCSLQFEREHVHTYNCYLYVYILIRHMLLCSPLRLDFLPLWLCTTIIKIEEVAWSSSSTAAVCWYTVLLFDKYHSAGMFGCLWYSFLPKPLSCAGDSNAFWFTLQLAILR